MAKPRTPAAKTPRPKAPPTATAEPAEERIDAAQQPLGAPDKPTPAERIAAAAVGLAGERGWRALSLGEIAQAADITLAELARHYGSRPEILDGFERMIDRRMLAGAAAGDINDKPRDRLFDIIMERFDALAPYRDGLRRIARELPLDPVSGMVLAAALPRSVAWMYAGARLKLGGPTAPLRLATLAGVYLSAFRVWIDEQSQDLPKTMATLDKNLDRAKQLFGAEFGPMQSAPSASATQAAPPEGAASPAPADAPDEADPDVDSGGVDVD